MALGRMLACHPSSPPCPGVEQIEVRAERPEPGRLALSYRVAGDIAALLLPPPATPAFVDGLWRHSCFEAFVSTGEDAAYCEVNLSPSSEWAAYAFDGYRSGMRALAGLSPPAIETSMGEGWFALQATIDIPALAGAGEWRLGLAAVIEDRAGRLGYWALAHGGERPDFHDPRGRLLVLRP